MFRSKFKMVLQMPVKLERQQIVGAGEDGAA